MFEIFSKAYSISKELTFATNISETPSEHAVGIPCKVEFKLMRQNKV